MLKSGTLSRNTSLGCHFVNWLFIGQCVDECTTLILKIGRGFASDSLTER